MLQLPHECILEIIRKLDYKSISNFLLTCKTINNIKLRSYFTKGFNRMRFEFKLCLEDKIKTQDLHKKYPWIVYADKPYYQAEFLNNPWDCLNHLYNNPMYILFACKFNYMYNNKNKYRFRLAKHGEIVKKINFNYNIEKLEIFDVFDKSNYFKCGFVPKGQYINLVSNIGVYKNIGIPLICNYSGTSFEIIVELDEEYYDLEMEVIYTLHHNDYRNMLRTFSNVSFIHE